MYDAQMFDKAKENLKLALQINMRLLWLNIFILRWNISNLQEDNTAIHRAQKML